MNSTNLLTKQNLFKKKSAEPEVLSKISEEVKERKQKMKDSPFHNKKWTLSETDKEIIVALFASGLTPTEVSDRVREEYNIDIHPVTIGQYARSEKWKPLIRKIREAHMNDLAAVSGSYKRVRLERHEKVYEKAIKKGDLRNAISCTVEQRKEMEGDGSVNVVMTQFNSMSDEELEHKKKVVMDRIQLMSTREVPK